MSSENVKNQHYVSQGYLRNFGEGDFIWAYDKFKRNKFRTNIRNVASERFFYDSEELSQKTGEKQFIEKRLGKIEDKYKSVANELFQKLRDPNFRLDDETRGFLAFFMAVQMCRTKESLADSTQMIEAMMATLKERYVKAELPVPPELQQDAKEMVQNIFLRTLVDPERIENYAQVLNAHVWIFKRAAPGEVFLTSDHPFAKRAHMDATWRSMGGISSTGIEFISLSPRGTCWLSMRPNISSGLYLLTARLALI